MSTLTDAQVDAIWNATVKAEGCQWYGGKDHICGTPALGGKHYCSEHYAKAYVKGSAASGKRKAKQVEREIQQLEEQLALKEAIAEQESEVGVEVEVVL
jgi:hypothetical protein